MRYRLTFRRRKRKTTADRLRKIPTGSHPRQQGTSTPDAERSELSTLLDPFPTLTKRLELGPRLPASAGGWVVETTERDTRRPLVLKVRTLERTQGWADWDRFAHEAKVLRSLRHPGIPRYIEHGDAGTVAYLLMTRAPGSSLQARLDQGERWSDIKLRHILARMLGVLAYLHDLNPPVFHGDIHPEHVVVSGAGDVQLLSFGCAFSMIDGQGMPRPDRPGYVRASTSADRRSAATDLYALGATIAAIASGADASQLPRRGDALALAACMKPSLVRDAVQMLMEPSPGRTRSPADELRRWLARQGR
ncbi:MAG: protein kinase [Myxococcota bacterium]